MSDINTGAITEALNNKADRDMRNAYPPAIIEQGTDGDYCYTLYNNGWCEQYGYISGSQVSIVFAKTYQSTPNISFAMVAGGGLGGTQVCPVVVNPSTTGFSINSYDGTGIYGYYWQARGFVSL